MNSGNLVAIFSCCHSFHILLWIFWYSFRNVPVRQMTTEEQEEIERKVAEIEKGGPTEDIDEDDAG